jgi:hypothetical protein
MWKKENYASSIFVDVKELKYPSLGVKRLGCEADHSPPSTEVKNAWSCTFTPTTRLHGVVLSCKKHRDSYLFALCDSVF